MTVLLYTLYMSAKNGKIKQCLYCSADKYVKKSKLNKMTFCTISCYWKYRVGKPMTNRKGVYKICSFCKKQIYIPQYKLKQEDNYCSWKCYRNDWARKHSGEKSPNWKGGRQSAHSGYYRLWQGNNTYKYEHIVVMENHLKRKLKKGEEVHHKDENTSNNNIDNLIVLSHKEHRRLHYYKSHPEKQR